MRRPFHSAEATADERVLAGARLAFGAASFVAIYLDPTEPSRYVVAAYALLLGYVTASAWLFLTLRGRRQWPSWAPIVTHLVDMLWLGILTSVTGASSSPLFPFLTFVILAAAYRWGFLETIATTVVLSALLFAQALALNRSAVDPDATFELNRFIVRAAYMVIAGFLIAYLASYQKWLRVESAVVARLLSKLRSETTLDAALEAVGHELLDTYGARSLAIVVRELHTGRSFAWTLSLREQRELKRVRLSLRDERRYFFDASAGFALRRRGDRDWMTCAIDATGTIIPVDPDPCSGPPMAFRRALVASVSFQNEWSGRAFVFDPQWRIQNVAGVRLLNRITYGILPALHSVYLVGRIRSRARTAERARLARDLHDTSMQSLIAIEMELLALSRQVGDANLRSKIAGLQSRLQSEIQGLRRLMIGPVRDTEVTPVTQRLSEVLAQFQIDTGIRSRFVSVAAVSVPPRLGDEILLLVQAALSNVKRHSRATLVDVALARDDAEGWLLVIEDDGSGFRDTGRYADPPAPARAPWSLRERVSALGGQLVVEPREGPGVRLEIRLPPLVVPV